MLPAAYKTLAILFSYTIYIVLWSLVMGQVDFLFIIKLTLSQKSLMSEFRSYIRILSRDSRFSFLVREWQWWSVTIGVCWNTTLPHSVMSSLPCYIFSSLFIRVLNEFSPAELFTSSICDTSDVNLPPTSCLDLG